MADGVALAPQQLDSCRSQCVVALVWQLSLFKQGIGVYEILYKIIVIGMLQSFKQEGLHLGLVLIACQSFDCLGEHRLGLIPLRE